MRTFSIIAITLILFTMGTTIQAQDNQCSAQDELFLEFDEILPVDLETIRPVDIVSHNNRIVGRTNSHNRIIGINRTNSHNRTIGNSNSKIINTTTAEIGRTTTCNVNSLLISIFFQC